MPKMEKGRPPENKRSRKPAHPVKRKVSQEIKNFAESTMNELLGWYGYNKVDLQDSEASDIRSYPGRTKHHQVSVLKENSDPKPGVVESKMSSSFSSPVKNGAREASSLPLSPSSSSSSPHVKDLHGTPIAVPLIKPSTVKEQQNVLIVCVWCQKEGLKRYSLLMGSELKNFCSEKCFAMCRRACFKRNKAQDRDRHGERAPLPSCQTEETSTQLVLKTNSNTRVCDWCKHVRHTKYLDLGAGEERLQFCSTKCLNQYKMNIFYREARAALTTTSTADSSPKPADKQTCPAVATGETQTLLTPESWDSQSLNGESKVPSPKTPTPPTLVSSAAAVLTTSSSSSARVSVTIQQPKERESAGPLQLQRSDASTLTPCLSMDHPSALNNPPPFLRPPLHGQGLHSPIRHSHRNPSSSPTRRPTHASQCVQTPSVHLQQLLRAYPGPVFPCTSTYPQFIPSLVPSLSLTCPQPTLLVPYPIIVPLPVPVPIPIPIPLSSGMNCHARVIRNPQGKGEGVGDTDLGNSANENNTKITVHEVKTEQALSSPEPCSTPFTSLTTQSPFAHQDLDSTPPVSAAPAEEQRGKSRERHVIQIALHRPLVKQGTKIQTGPEVTEQRESEQAPSWANLDNEDNLTTYVSNKHNVVTSIDTCSPSHASSPTHTVPSVQSTQASLILQKAPNLDSNNAASVVTPTAPVFSNAALHLHPSSYSSTRFSTGQDTLVSLDRPNLTCEHKTNSAPVLAVAPDPEDVKENFSTGRELGLKCFYKGDHTDCQTDQSENSRGGTSEDDSPTANEEHTYARCIPPKLREKTAHTVAHTHSHPFMHTWDKSSHTHLHTVELNTVQTDIEPVLKRRCLRIKDQNK